MDKKIPEILIPDADEGTTVGTVPAQPGQVRDIMTPAPVGVAVSRAQPNM